MSNQGQTTTYTDAAAVAFLDSLISRLDPILDTNLTNGLLELRASWKELLTSPSQAVATFMKVRPEIDHLPEHEREMLLRYLNFNTCVKVSTPSVTRYLPLNLNWRNYDGLLNYYRREEFEFALCEWSEIEVTVQSN